MSLKISLLRNAGASSVTKVVGSVCTVAVVPILLAMLGVEKYGIWLVIAAVPSWLSITDVGFGQVAANEISIRVARDDWEGGEAVFQSAWVAILTLSALAECLVALAVYFGSWGDWLSISAISSGELSWCLLVLGSASIVALQGQVAVGLFRAAGRADFAILIGGSKPLLDLFSMLVALWWSRTLLAASVGLLCSQILLVALGTLLGLKICPRIRLGFSRCNGADIKFCAGKGLAFCLIPLSNALTLQGSTLIVNHVLGATAVVVFNTCRTMIRSAQQLMNMVGNSAWPEISHLVGRGDLARARRLHHFAFVINFVLALSMISVMVVVGPSVYSIWTGRQIQVDRWLIGAFSLGVLGNAAWFASSAIVGAANRHERLALAYLVGALITLPLCYFGATWWGLYAAAVAAVFADFVVAPIAIWQANQVTKESLPDFCRGLVAAVHDALRLSTRLFASGRQFRRRS